MQIFRELTAEIKSKAEQRFAKMIPASAFVWMPTKAQVEFKGVSTVRLCLSGLRLCQQLTLLRSCRANNYNPPPLAARANRTRLS
jgi:hypothetical protein